MKKTALSALLLLSPIISQAQQLKIPSRHKVCTVIAEYKTRKASVKYEGETYLNQKLSPETHIDIWIEQMADTLSAQGFTMKVFTSDSVKHWFHAYRSQEQTEAPAKVQSGVDKVLNTAD